MTEATVHEFISIFRSSATAAAKATEKILGMLELLLALL
jgi:hypothetical protein